MYATQIPHHWTPEEQKVHYKRVAREIKANKIGIKELDADLVIKIAPYLKFLRIEGGFNSRFDSKFFFDLLFKCKKLRHLNIAHSPIAQLPLEPLSHLKRLEIENCDALSVHWRLSLLFVLFQNSPHRLLKIAKKIEMEAYIPVLLFEKTAQQNFLQNLEKLEQASLIRHFCYLFPICMNTFNLLAKELLFTGKRSEDKVLIKLLFAITFQSPIQLQEKLSESLIHFLRMETGKALAAMNLEFFFNNALWMESLLKARPPDRKENLSIYLQSKEKNRKLYLNLWQKIPLYQPKILLKKLSTCRRLDIRYFANNGIDEGALGKDFIVRLFQGILKGHPYLHFEKNQSGKFYLKPQNLLKTHYKEEIAAFALGHLFGLVIKHGYPAGTLFSKKWLHTILSIPYDLLEEPSFNSEAFLMQLSMSCLEKMLDFPNTPHMVECLQHIQNVLKTGDHHKISLSANWLNAFWEEDAIAEAIASKNINKIQQKVKQTWIRAYKGYATLAYFVAKGVKSMLPLRIGHFHVESWKQLPWISTHKFSIALQGKQNVLQIKELLSGPEDILSWLHAWIDAHSNEPESLANVIQAFTGARSLIDKIKFSRRNNIPDIVIETCFQIVYVSNEIDEMGFKYLLDYFATEYDSKFPMY